jgi:hypothetical protein
MKQILLFIILLLILGTRVFKVNAQSLFIKTLGGTEINRDLSSIQNLTFNNGKLMLTYVGGSNDLFSISSISKLYFNSTITGFENPVIAGRMSIYPNPVGDYVNIINAPQGNYTVTIFRMDGLVVLQTNGSSDEPIGVGVLSKGIYLIRINNQVLKLIKL